MAFDLVIFDCDGVLVDSEPIVNRVFVDMVGELGFALDFESSLREFSGGSTALRLRTMQERFRWSAPAEFADAYGRRIGEALAQELRPVPGVVDALALLSGPRCVASNGSSADIRARLDIAGLLGAFEPHLFSASEVARGKPYPDLFLHAAARMGANPARCAVVEDSVPGVRGAVAAGMTVFGYARITSARALAEAGAVVFAEMDELPELLGAAVANQTNGTKS